MFVTSSLEPGKQLTGAWAQLSLRLPARSPALHQSVLLTPGQKLAERGQDHGNVMRALAEFPLDLLERVVELPRVDAWNR